MHALITADELIREGKPRHEATLLEPEKKMPPTAADASRRSANIDPRSEIHVRAQSTFFLTQGIVSTASKTRPLCWVLDIGVDEKGVCLRMDVLHHDLEP